MTTDTVFAIVLAAGRSSRFGSTKQLLPIGGVPMVRRACELARSVCGDSSLLVVGHDQASVLAAAEHPFFIVNNDFERGIGSSIALSVRAIRHAADAVLVMLADQAAVTPGHLRALLAAHAVEPEAIVCTSFAETVGPPAVFPSAAFDQLAALDGDEGARAIIQRGEFKTRSLPFEPGGIDIDRPSDIDLLR